MLNYLDLESFLSAGSNAPAAASRHQGFNNKYGHHRIDKAVTSEPLSASNEAI